MSAFDKATLMITGGTSSFDNTVLKHFHNYDVRDNGKDIQILMDERYLEIFRMVDYSICGLSVDRERPYSYETSRIYEFYMKGILGETALPV